MSVQKSVIEEIELESGVTMYVQINNNRASISAEVGDIQSVVWLTIEELEKLRKTISTALVQAK